MATKIKTSSEINNKYLLSTNYEVPAATSGDLKMYKTELTYNLVGEIRHMHGRG